MVRCPNKEACTRNNGRRELALATASPFNRSNNNATWHYDVPGNWSWYEAQLCSPGYAGLLCSSCRPGWGQTEPFTCDRCSITKEEGHIATSRIILILVGFGTSVAVVVWFTVQRSIRENQQHVRGSHLRKLDLTDVVKTLVMYLQYLAIIVKMPVAWPDQLATTFDGLSRVWSWAFASPAALDCLLASMGANRAGARALVALAAPVAAYWLLLACHALWWCTMPWFHAALSFVLTGLLKRLDFVAGMLLKWPLSGCLHSFLRIPSTARRPNFWEYMKLRAIVTLLVTVFFFYPAVARVAVGMFSCMEVCGDRYWLMDMSLTCPRDSVGQSQWKWAVGLGVPAVLFCVAVPIFVVVWLQHAQHAGRMNQERFIACYGFMYSNYRIDPPVPHGGRLARLLSSARYRVNIVWDAVVHCQTLMLVFIAVYCRIWHEFYQAQLLSAALAVYLLAIAVFRPFRLLATLAAYMFVHGFL
ncbi:hypothetical protein OEZ85_002307 [Tetradesmus obliquus]|uniref:Uncharacterized protein n=1 Tax=Tetradesmus obliquus TaxID=3088 RepID=A0ABY8U5F4_TETOB|nr:hypothetical protein OEZ85_002307 [Tetradesmus obliquus]